MRYVLTMACALGFGLLGAAASADAHGARHACESCGAAGTTRHYRTIHPVRYVTRYHDRSVYHYVTRLHYVINVTRIQPIIQVRDVTRLHHYTVVRNAYAEPPQQLFPLPYAPQSGCGCTGE